VVKDLSRGELHAYGVGCCALTHCHKLVSGPGIPAEGHVKDRNVVVHAQVSVRPLRTPIMFGLEGVVPEDDDAGT
jgi:hypothetical protein